MKRDSLVVDYDGEVINQGKAYSTYRREDKIKRSIRPDDCKHKKVMRTLRCTCCQQVDVVFVKGMVK